MRRKVFATLCAAAMLVSAVSVAAPKTVKAAPAPLASYDFEDGFGDMTAAANGETPAPSLVTDEIKGGAVKLEFGANGAESYTTFANPYVGKELSAATITLWVNVPEDAPFWEYDNLVGFFDGEKRLTFQAMPYLCWNAGGDSWIDVKAPAAFNTQKGRWVNYAFVITPEGQTLYVNGEAVESPEVNHGEAYNAADILPFLSAEATQGYLGFGSFWGSQGAVLDDVTFYDVALTADEIREACNIEAVLAAMPELPEAAEGLVDLSTVTAAVPEGYSSYYAFDGDLTDAVTGQTGNTVGYMVHLEAEEEEASYEDGVNGQAVAFYGFGDAVKLPTAPKGSQYTISIDWYIKKTSQYTPGVFLVNAHEDGSITGGDEDAQWVSITPLGWQADLVDGPMVWSRNVPGDAAWNDLFRTGNGLAKVETWMNVAVVADGATATIYVDGSMVAQGPIADIVGEGTLLYLGVNAWDIVFNGYMDNLYIYDRCLTPEEVAGLAKASLTPDPIVYEKVDLSTVTAAVPEGYSSFYGFDGNLADAVTGQEGNTVGYMVHLEAEEEEASYETGVKGQAVAFYGFGDAVKLPTAPKGSQYTISIDWYIKKTSQYTPGVFLVNTHEDGSIMGGDEDAQWVSITPLGWQADLVDGPMVWSRNVPGGAAWNDLFRTGNDLAKVETWFNVAVVADGATATIYVDGSIVQQGPIADIVGEGTQLYLGVNAWDTVFNGYMDNLYIYDRCLTAQEVASLAKDSLTAEQTTPEPTPEPTTAPTEAPTKAPETPTNTPVPTQAASAPAEDKGSNTGLVVGIVVVVVVVAAAAGVVVMKKKNSK